MIGNVFRPSPHRLGAMGEGIARLYLEAHGYLVLEAGFRTREGEIDLIASRAGVAVFVEVKTRRGRACGSPEDAVDRRKLMRMRRVAGAWISGGCCRGIREFRFDVVGVDVRPGGLELRHLKGVAGW